MYFPLKFLNSHFLSHPLRPLNSNPKPITDLLLPTLDNGFSLPDRHMQTHI